MFVTSKLQIWAWRSGNLNVITSFTPAVCAMILHYRSIIISFQSFELISHKSSYIWLSIFITINLTMLWVSQIMQDWLVYYTIFFLLVYRNMMQQGYTLMLVDERNLMYMLYVNIEQKYIYKYKWLRNVRKNMRALHGEVLNTPICCIISPNAVHTADFKNLSSYHISSVFTAIKCVATIVMRCKIDVHRAVHRNIIHVVKPTRYTGESSWFYYRNSNEVHLHQNLKSYYACVIWSLGPGRLKLMLKNDVKRYASNRSFN